MKILFVCTGNTCRSCMAESIFNKRCNIEGVSAYSAGLSIVPGSIASKHSAHLVLTNLCHNISERKAVQLTSEMIKSADLILTMTSHMKQLLTSNLPQYNEKIYSICEFVSVEGEISDPYGGSIGVYEKTYNQLDNIVGMVLSKLKEDKGIS
ncbi:protein-tyrosine-phosphatase [Clostridium polyendosporum]|uniref:Protein-tyrosine-phosphatase n=1 Tax=Clostridium polyendosporum TaxID=69208 RepID=A0A919S1V3_9CLOT|nr:low molecular weight protein arginine phosphatase [Clostridium polyendosporum]GIM29665.1 protein-tyrosine-phosphatase [Clostridium polyendosporum]